MKGPIRKVCIVVGMCFLMSNAGFHNVFAKTHTTLLEELTTKSQIIITGKVVEKKSVWNKGKTRIYTEVQISVDEVIKGNLFEKKLTVTHLGGEIDDVGEVYSGASTFESNEEVLLFLKNDNQNRLRVTGSGQGKFKISKDLKTGQKLMGNQESLKDFSRKIKIFVNRQKSK